MKNKYKSISTALFWFSILMILAMGVHLYFDYQNYLNHPEWSAPFSVYFIARGVLYGVLVALGLVLSFILRKKGREIRND